MDLSNLPVVDYSGGRAEEYELLDRLAVQLAAYRPEGFRCSAHGDVAERLKEEHCGPWFAELGYEPFPAGFYTQDGRKVSWHIFRAPDGLWRPMPGALCGFTLSDAQVELLVAQEGLRVALDRQTGWPCLVDVDGEAPVLAREDWEGECTGCGLCLTPDTPILYEDLQWRPIGDAKIGDVLLAFDETGTIRSPRKLRRSVIEGIRCSRKPTRRLVLDDREVFTTDEHRWLTNRGWFHTSRLFPTSLLYDVGREDGPGFSDDYRLGYIAGMTVGDGTARLDPCGRTASGPRRPYWRVALKDPEPIGRLVMYLASFGISTEARPFVNSQTSFNPGAVMQQVCIQTAERLGIIRAALNRTDWTNEFSRGWLAGFFDAEGCFSKRHLRLSQHRLPPLDTVIAMGKGLGLEFELEKASPTSPQRKVLLRGGLPEQLRFFTACAPAIARKRNFIGKTPRCARKKAQVVDDVMRDVVDIQTSTSTFFANGLATHNCCFSPRVGTGAPCAKLVAGRAQQ